MDQSVIPCLMYCGDDLCNCSASIYYKELEWQLTQGPKEQAEKLAYEIYYAKLVDLISNAHPAVAQEK